METMLSKTKVELMGKPYTLKGDVDPEYMKNVARYVDTKIRELQDIAPQTDVNRLSLLVALNLADELFQSREEYRSLSSSIAQENPQATKEKLESMISLLEKGMVGELLH